MDLHWLPVAQRIEFKIALLTFKCVHDMAPSYLCELIHNASLTRALRSSDKHHLPRVQRSSNSVQSRAFERHAPEIWNALPDWLRLVDSISVFKKQLKTLLFMEYFI
jgi:hypothetical protein